MRRKIFLVLFAIFLVSAALHGLATADTFYVFNPDQWDVTKYDANKSWNGDGNLCWAAAASNILAWDNWGKTYTTGPSVFSYFKQYWSNEGGLPQYGWQWWFDGNNGAKDQQGWAQVSGGGKFWPQFNFYDYFDTRWYNPSLASSSLMAAVDSFLHLGYGVTLGIYKPAANGGWYGHALTAWGFDYTIQNGNRIYTDIYVTDSDDYVTELKRYSLSLSQSEGWWYLSDYYGGGWHISDVEALKGSAVPIPGSLLLFGSGLMAWRSGGENYCKSNGFITH